MPAIQYANNAKSTLAADLSNVATSLLVATGDGAKFPALATGQYFKLTLEKVDGSAVEIVHCTARSSDTLTISRGQEGTAAHAFVIGDLVENRITRDTLSGIVRLDEDTQVGAFKFYVGDVQIASLAHGDTRVAVGNVLTIVTPSVVDPLKVYSEFAPPKLPSGLGPTNTVLVPSADSIKQGAGISLSPDPVVPSILLVSANPIDVRNKAASVVTARLTKITPAGALDIADDPDNVDGHVVLTVSAQGSDVSLNNSTIVTTAVRLNFASADFTVVEQGAGSHIANIGLAGTSQPGFIGGWLFRTTDLTTVADTPFSWTTEEEVGLGTGEHIVTGGAGGGPYAGFTVPSSWNNRWCEVVGTFQIQVGTTGNPVFTVRKNGAVFSHGVVSRAPATAAIPRSVQIHTSWFQVATGDVIDIVADGAYTMLGTATPACSFGIRLVDIIAKAIVNTTTGISDPVNNLGFNRIATAPATQLVDGKLVYADGASWAPQGLPLGAGAGFYRSNGAKYYKMLDWLDAGKLPARTVSTTSETIGFARLGVSTSYTAATAVTVTVNQINATQALELPELGDTKALSTAFFAMEVQQDGAGIVTLTQGTGVVINGPLATTGVRTRLLIRYVAKTIVETNLVS